MLKTGINMKTFILLSALMIASVQCADTDPEFNEYWYQGKAEISSYELHQSRYGENRVGEAVNIFVTEDFSKSKQVKLDYPQENISDKVPVLKLNMTRKFNTGVYPYSIMQSSFTAVEPSDGPSTLKVTASSQEWCGHTFSQLNLKDDGYHFDGKSYFESEGDVQLNLGKHLCEDELWTQIRINPNELPEGNVKLIPSLVFSRLRHTPMKAFDAVITKSKSKDGIIEYTIKYKEIQRSLTIFYGADFPHKIEGWEESYLTGWAATVKSQFTKATRKKTILLDYWNKNSIQDSIYRNQLDLH